MSRTTLKNFINHCFNDSEFLAGGIPTKENYYIKNLNLTEEDVNNFYKAMSILYYLNMKLNKRNK